MTKKELAALLGISGAMVSKLSKRGMPTDSLERATRWRKRHLEPGRVKGARFDPTAAAAAAAATIDAVPKAGTRNSGTTNRAAVVQTTSEEYAEMVAMELDEAIAEQGPDGVADSVERMRAVLRAMLGSAEPTMSLRVWVALVDWCLNEKSPVRETAQESPDSLVTAERFGLAAAPDIVGGLGPNWLDIACDWGGYSTAGIPDEEAAA